MLRGAHNDVRFFFLLAFYSKRAAKHNVCQRHIFEHSHKLKLSFPVFLPSHILAEGLIVSSEIVCYFLYKMKHIPDPMLVRLLAAMLACMYKAKKGIHNAASLFMIILQ